RRRADGLPGARRDDAARRALAGRAADGDRGGTRPAYRELAADAPTCLRRTVRRRDPAARGVDVRLRLRSPRVLARRARPAAARVRPPPPANARRARVGA